MEEHIKVANKMIRFATKDFNTAHKKSFKNQFIGIYNKAKEGSYGGLMRNENGYRVPYITIAQRSMVGAESRELHFKKQRGMRHLSSCKTNWGGCFAAGYFERWMFVEYPSFHLSKSIGGFYSDDYRLHRDATIAHEIAHAVQAYCHWHNYHRFGTDYKSHGLVWKELYSRLREKYINPYIEHIDKKELAGYIIDYKKIYDERVK